MRWIPLVAVGLAARGALACPSLPEGTEWWTEEVAPQCGSRPLREALALYDAPNLCDGPCPRVCQVTRGDDHASVVSYDARGRWIGAAPLINGYAGSSESCSYDAAGHRDRCTIHYTPRISSASEVERDRAGHVVAITGDDTTTRFTYDRRGRVTEAITPSERWTYRYDARDRLASEVRVSRGSRRETITRYRYDRAGRLVARTSPEARATFAYAAGRLVEQTSTVGLRQLGGPTTHVVRFTYDEQGRPLTAGDIMFGYCP